MKVCLTLMSLVAALVFSVNAQAGFFDRVESKTGDYCKDQLYSYLDYKFGDELVIEKMQTASGGSKGSKHKQYWISSNLCEDYIVVFTIAKPGCKVAHYGSVPKLIRRVSGFGDCRSVIPRDLFPTKAEMPDVF